jgi:hypothetical protein
MTVSELIKELEALPQDIQVMMLDSDRESPVEIVQVSRGSWSDDVSDEEIDDDWEPSDEEPEFVQDDENGKIAVLIVW